MGVLVNRAATNGNHSVCLVPVLALSVKLNSFYGEQTHQIHGYSHEHPAGKSAAAATLSEPQGYAVSTSITCYCSALLLHAVSARLVSPHLDDVPVC
jgi:hypothetical protein